MSPAPVAALVVALTLSAVLIVSGAAKLRDPRATRDAFLALRVPEVVPAGPGAAALPWLEIVLAVLLLVSPAGWAWLPAAAVLVLMVAYTALVARALTFDEAVSCSCFGSLGRHEIDRTTLGRNLLLTALAVVVTALALDRWSAPSTLTSLDADGWWTLGAAAAAAAVAVLVTGGGPSARPAPGPDEPLLDYVRAPIPYGVLSSLDGTTATLVELATTQARLVVILSAGCGPCVRTAARLDAWAEELAPAVSVLAVYPDEESAAGDTGHASDMSMWDPERNVRRVLDAASVPTALLLGADGQLAGGPVLGEDKVAEFFAEVIAEVRGASEAVPAP